MELIFHVYTHKPKCINNIDISQVLTLSVISGAAKVCQTMTRARIAMEHKIVQKSYFYFTFKITFFHYIL